MNLSDRSDSYLKKTYCYLVKNVLPQNNKNMKEFPPAEIWIGVRDEIIKAISFVSAELSSRDIDAESLNCSVYEF